MIVTSNSQAARVSAAVLALRECALAVPLVGDLDAIRAALLPVFDGAHDVGALLNNIEQEARDEAFARLAQRTKVA
jgi:hypothetical protein